MYQASTNYQLVSGCAHVNTMKLSRGRQELVILEIYYSTWIT